MSKGSGRRPREVDLETFENNWEKERMRMYKYLVLKVKKRRLKKRNTMLDRKRRRMKNGRRLPMCIGYDIIEMVLVMNIQRLLQLWEVRFQIYFHVDILIKEYLKKM